ncbi:MAG: LPS-assembly protein LptD [Pseudomonadota bacterium]|nr:LPS-assembly protein LptD [Pseudomonadota bacterium]
MEVRGRHQYRRGIIAAAALLTALASPHAYAAGTDDAPLKGKVLMRADQIVYDTDHSVVSAEGHVEVDSEGRIMLADKVAYDQNNDTVTASGNISVLAPNGDVAFADRVVLTHGMRAGVLDGFKALIGRTGRLAAVRAVRTTDDVTAATRAVYTPCEICNKPGERTPSWQIKASHMIYDEKNHRIYYRDAVLELFGVPVFYTPYFSHADPTVKHKSGILRPEFGSSSTIGTFIKLPYYVAFTDSRDMTIAPMLTTGGGDILQTEYRERWDHGGMWLQAASGYNPDGGLSGHQHQWYSSLFGAGRIPLTGIWSAGYDVQLTSNDTFLKRYNFSSEDNLVNDLFISAVSGRSHFSITSYFFQDLRAGHIGAGQMPLVLPLVEYTYDPERQVLGGRFRFTFSGSGISRSVGADSQHVSAEMRWQHPLVTAGGQLITFTLDARGDAFHVNNNDPTATDLLGNPLPTHSRYISRGQPYMAVDWRWPFINSGSIAGNAFVIEPIAQLIAAPYGGNPAGIPNENSTDFELDETDIFSLDRLPGNDLWESGPRANVGMRAEAFFPTGSVEMLLGQVFRLKPNPIFSTGSGFSGKTSDIVGRYTIKFPPYFSLTHRVDLDVGDGTVRRNEVYLDGTYHRSNLAVSYVQLSQQAAMQNSPREEINGEATIGVLDHWAVYAAARRDLVGHQMLSSEFGIGWENDCLGLAIAYQRRYTRDRDLPPSTSVFVRIIPKFGGSSDESSSLFPQHVFSTP